MPQQVAEHTARAMAIATQIHPQEISLTAEHAQTATARSMKVRHIPMLLAQQEVCDSHTTTLVAQDAPTVALRATTTTIHVPNVWVKVRSIGRA